MEALSDFYSLESYLHSLEESNSHLEAQLADLAWCIQSYHNALEEAQKALHECGVFLKNASSGQVVQAVLSTLNVLKKKNKAGPARLESLQKRVPAPKARSKKTNLNSLSASNIVSLNKLYQHFLAECLQTWTLETQVQNLRKQKSKRNRESQKGLKAEKRTVKIYKTARQVANYK